MSCFGSFQLHIGLSRATYFSPSEPFAATQNKSSNYRLNYTLIKQRFIFYFFCYQVEQHAFLSVQSQKEGDKKGDGGKEKMSEIVRGAVCECGS